MVPGSVLIHTETFGDDSEGYIHVKAWGGPHLSLRNNLNEVN